MDRTTHGLSMDSTNEEQVKGLLSLSECCICLKAYTDPRMLPCLHNACLKCFEDMMSMNKKKPGDVLPCPFCREEFSIPAEGMIGLKKNFLIENLMEVTRAFNFEKKALHCVMCGTDEEEAKGKTEATMRCLNCCESYCLNCSKTHKRLKATKDHRIVEINSEYKEEEIRNMLPIRKCKRHSDKALDYYCSNCKTLVCVSCFVEDHQTHKCKDVNTMDKDFRQMLEKTSVRISDYRELILSKKLALERQKGSFLAKTMDTEKAVKRNNQQLKALVDRHTEDVLNELSLKKQQHQKQMEVDIEEIERKLTVIESFVTYCTELKSKGSASEVCGNVDSLMTRAEEINKENKTYLSAASNSVDFEFIVADPKTLSQMFRNVIGKLSESTKVVESYAIVISLDEGCSLSKEVAKINLNKSENVVNLQEVPFRKMRGSAAAGFGNSVFITGVGKSCDEIWRFDATSSIWSKCASLVRGRQRHSVAFVGHVLYICGGRAMNELSIDGIEAYDSFGDKCNSVGQLRYHVECSGTCIAFQDNLYFFGVRIFDSSRAVQVYDTKLNKCIVLDKPMPKAYRGLQAVLCESNVILLSNDGCSVYNIETDVWEERSQFKADVHDFSLITSNGYIFIIAGSSEKDFRLVFKGSYVKCVSVANILSNKPIDWICHARLPITSRAYICGKVDLSV